jgi:(p)ppGpp synthase/HD superfamily hydrolase
MTPRFTRALYLAASAHEGQVRKSTPIPYITHPVAVAALVAQFGGDEDQQIAALLHDVLEDGGPHFGPIIHKDFGPRVLRIVEGCTDGTPDASGTKAPWKERKVAYLAHLAQAADEVLLVSGCDKLNNASAILHDLVHTGPSVFNRFNASKEDTLWYYQELADIFKHKSAPMASHIIATVAEIKQRAS